MPSKAKQSGGRTNGMGAPSAHQGGQSRGSGRGSSPPQSGEASRSERSEKDRKALEKLVETGKSKGFLTYDEVNDALPADVAPDQLDDVVGALGDEDIEIVDGATQVKIAPKRIADEEAIEKKLVVTNERDAEEDVDYY